MAILWMDGFDTYTTVADVLMRYPGVSGLSFLSTTGGRFGGGCIGSSNNNSNIGYGYMGPATIPHTTTAIIAGGAHLIATNTNSYCCLGLGNTLGGSSGINELTLFFDYGVFRLYRGGSSGTLLATTTNVYANGVYHHIEAKAVIADSGGSCEIRINGVTAINYSGDTRQSVTGTAGIDRVGFTSSGTSTASGAWDDIYVLDTTGSFANDFLGDVRINTLAPTSDSSVQFTRSTGASNYLCVDEGRYNSDTDYVESSTVGHTDKYGYADLAAGVTTVHGVQAVCWAKKTDATTRTIRQNIYSSASTAAQTAFGLTIGYAPYYHVAALNPDGSVQWTPTSVNAALAGFEIVS